MAEPKIQPKSIDRAGSGIKITWQDGAQSEFEGKFLRQACPCALCRETPGHPAPQPIPPGEVSVKAANPMGWYALQLIFSDGHDSGIFTYEYLRELGSKG
ncbi:MAG: DUF971 domain-containing protein [bacterium]|nr:DUF971 domain-containing protein [bacterium]